MISCASSRFGSYVQICLDKGLQHAPTLRLEFEVCQNSFLSLPKRIREGGVGERVRDGFRRHSPPMPALHDTRSTRCQSKAGLLSGATKRCGGSAPPDDGARRRSRAALLAPLRSSLDAALLLQHGALHDERQVLEQPRPGLVHLVTPLRLQGRLDGLDELRPDQLQQGGDGMGKGPRGTRREGVRHAPRLATLRYTPRRGETPCQLRSATQLLTSTYLLLAP